MDKEERKIARPDRTTLAQPDKDGTRGQPMVQPRPVRPGQPIVPPRPARPVEPQPPAPKPSK
jgi:hypothetical protein